MSLLQGWDGSISYRSEMAPWEVPLYGGSPGAQDSRASCIQRSRGLKGPSGLRISRPRRSHFPNSQAALVPGIFASPEEDLPLYIECGLRRPVSRLLQAGGLPADDQDLGEPDTQS